MTVANTTGIKTWEETPLADLEIELDRVLSVKALQVKKIQEAMLKLSMKIETSTDHKTLAKKIREQAEDVKQLSWYDEHAEFITKIIEKKKAQAETSKDTYKVIREFIADWKAKEIAWYQEKYDNGDRKDCSKQDKKLLDAGMDVVIKAIEEDAEIRLNTLIFGLKDKVGEVTECKLQRNESYGFDGWVTGTKKSVNIQTIVAGGWNIQRAHYRTLMN